MVHIMPILSRLQTRQMDLRRIAYAGREIMNEENVALLISLSSLERHLY